MEDLNLIPERGEQEKEGDDYGHTATVEHEDRASGLVNHLLYNIISSEENKENEERTEREAEREEEEGEEREKGAVDERDDVSAVQNGDSDKGGGTGGKIISNLISKIFHQGEDHEKLGNKEERGAKDITVNENGGSGEGGLLDKIISHFPASLPDDAAPTRRSHHFNPLHHP